MKPPTNILRERGDDVTATIVSCPSPTSAAGLPDGLPPRVLAAVRYCETRGAVVWVANGIAPIDDADGRRWVDRAIVTVVGAPDGDAVALRLGGFVPDARGWVWIGEVSP